MVMMDTMSISLFQWATLTITTTIGICLFLAILQMRKAYSEQRYKFARALTAVEEFQKNHKEFMSLLRRVESDGHALQQIALQVEQAVATLNQGISSAVMGAAERQSAAVEHLRDHLDTQEQRFDAALA